MVWIARLLLLIPALIAGRFISQDDPKYWIASFGIFLVLMVLMILFNMYIYPGKERGDD
ncbi:hypothetical protein Y88_3451 [Novosphingobium nitrogenifigens DSM 19370]|uniref:Uncharacterized protein n=1 Tax=Novosphingobium nitrogenifigens DSM 19370 TaxID=983920 RepID=F1Z366_9SPHN|nr:hypothetical protein [Novosphingobium nitrogenifigens]EGD60947.1 hypothetical protein Y88_3451 [Novosphingobium nitrogenifigens DSM 19370]